MLEARQRNRLFEIPSWTARARLAAINQLRVSGGEYRFTRAMRGVNRDYTFANCQYAMAGSPRQSHNPRRDARASVFAHACVECAYIRWKKRRVRDRHNRIA